MSQNIRPEKIRKAAKYLCTEAKLFMDHGVVYDDTWKINPIEDQRIGRDVEQLHYFILG